MKTITAFLAAALLLVSCVKDLDDAKPALFEAKDSVALVTLSLAMPPATRVMGTADENKVNQVDVLLFTSNNNDAYYYRAAGVDLNTDPTSSAAGEKKTFTVRLPFTPTSGAYPANTTYRLVVVANARDAVNNFTPTLAPATIVTGGPVTLANVVDGLAASVTAAMPTSAFPMWGEVAGVVISEGVATPSIPVNLTRAVARVDVSVENGVDFTLESVRLYNRNCNGLVAPGAATPHLPGALNNQKGPAMYTVPAGQESNFEKAIYTFEAAAGSLGANWKSNTCLVIGGRFGGVTAPLTAPLTYYRVEFAANSVPFALKRNYLYDVSILQVKAHGYPDETGAYENRPANIVVEIIPWDEGELNDVAFNNYHYIAVDKSHLEFYKDVNPKSLRVVTNYPSGWTVDDSSFPSWLHVSGATSGVAAVAVPLTLYADEYPDATGSRSHAFYIVAGNLRKEITVAQTSEREFSLEVDPWEMVFYKNPRTAKTITITPFPTGAGHEIRFSDPGFSWESGFALPANIAPAALSSISIQPVPNAGSTTLYGSILVTLNGPGGQSVTRVVTIKQLARDVFEALLASNPYPAAGGNALTFTVTSDVPWQLSESSDFLALGDETDEHDATSSFAYTFALDPSPLFTGRSATVTVTSSDPDFPPTTFDILQAGWSPSLVINDPSSKTHNFSTATTAKEVKLTTNAPWTFSVSGSAIVATPTPAAGDKNTDYTPDRGAAARSVTFAPPATESSDAAAGTVLEATVTFETLTASPLSETVTLKRDVRPRWGAVSFAPTPSTGDFPAAGGSTVKATVSTNADWYAQVKDDAANTKKTQTASAHASKSLTVSIPANTTTANKSIVVQAAYDGGTVSSSPTYTQLWAPTLNFTSPSNKILDFGSATTAQDVSFKTNYPWKYVINNATDYAKVASTTIKAGSNTIAANTSTAISGGFPASLADAPTVTLTFTPSTSTAVAGTDLSATVDFSTVSGVGPEDSETLTLKRKVPVRWDNLTFAPNPSTGVFPSTTGSTVKATVSTNADWYAQMQGVSSTKQTQTASTYASKNLTVSIPANTTTANRSVIVEAAYNGGTASSSSTYTQRWAPTLNFTSSTINFGTSSATKDAEFKTNYPWRYTTDSEYSKVVANASVAPSSSATTSVGAFPASLAETGASSVTFTPQTDNSIGKGNDVLTSVATFSAVPDNGEATITKTLTLKRTVPVVWSISSYTPSNGKIAATGGTVTLYATTNVDWWADLNGGAKSQQTVSGYTANSSIAISVPALSPELSSSYGTTVSSTIHAGYSTSSARDITITQSGYNMSGYMSVSGVVYTTLNISITSNLSNWTVYVKTSPSSSGNLATFSGSNNGSGTVTIPVTNTARTIYLVDGAGRELSSITQPASPDYTLVSYPVGRVLAGRSDISCPAGYSVYFYTTDPYVDISNFILYGSFTYSGSSDRYIAIRERDSDVFSWMCEVYNDHIAMKTYPGRNHSDYVWGMELRNETSFICKRN
jgi:hypothetical protein